MTTGCELVLDLDEDNDEPPVAEPQPTDPPETGPVDGDFVRPANCTSDCCDACAMVGECTGSQLDFADCERTCEDSIYVANQDIQCLALRIYWIDEEGCGSIVAAYERFDLADDCQGPQF